MPRSRSSRTSIGGRPAVGSPSKSFVRADANPESSRSKYGLDDDNARKIGWWRISSPMIRIARPPSGTPTWTCMPQISNRRAGHWRASTRSRYRCCGLTCCSLTNPNGWVPALTRVNPRRSALARSSAMVARRSSAASAGLSHTPVMISTVLWNSSCLALGCSPPGWPAPISARISLEADVSAPVARIDEVEFHLDPDGGSSILREVDGHVVTLPRRPSAGSAVPLDGFGDLLRCGDR